MLQRFALTIAILTATLAWGETALARDRQVAVGEALQDAINTSEPGDVIRLAPGLHDGPVVVDRELTLLGEPGAIVDGHGQGTVVTITVPGVTVRGLHVRGSGSSHEDLDSGIKATKTATGAQIIDNRLTGNLFGIDIHGAKDARVAGNEIIGRRDHRMNARGNGIYIWNAPGTVVEDNDVRYGRDGIFVNTSKRNVFRDNRFTDLRFAIHYMYTQDSEIAGNVSRDNHVGYALMYSRDLVVRDNVSSRDRDHGIMLNYANDALVEGNTVTGGGEKCLFMYNANKNRVLDNRFEACPIGIHFTAGSERNDIVGNAFIGNRVQVKYVGSRWLDWSDEGRGNYWSDHAAFDIDGNGIADTAYRPNDMMDHILWTQPAARLLLGSPAVQLIRWAQAKFPALLPGGIIDSRPLMTPVAHSAAMGGQP